MFHAEFHPSISSGRCWHVSLVSFMPFCLKSCCDACNFFSSMFSFRDRFLLLPLSDTREYLPSCCEFPGRTKKAELEGQKLDLQHWGESPLALPCSAAAALVRLVCVLLQLLGSIQMNRDPEFNRFLPHTSPISPVASHKHLFGLQRDLWSFYRECVAFISLRVATMAFILLSGAWNAAGSRPQVSSDNGTQTLKRNEKPKLCKSTALSNSQFPFHSPTGSGRFPVCRGGGTDWTREGFQSKSVYVCSRQAVCSNAQGPGSSHLPQFPICKTVITFY